MISRLRSHPGLAAVLVVLLMLPAPLIWLGSSTNLLDPVLYSAVIESDVVFDAECNLISRQVTRELGQQDHLAELTELTVNHDWHSFSHIMAFMDDKDWETTLVRVSHPLLDIRSWPPTETEALVRDAGISSCVQYAGESFTTRAKAGRTWLAIMTLSTDVWEMEIEPVQG